MSATPGTDPRDARILDALRAAAPGVVSGEAIAAELGVSRVAVAKRITRMREAGYEIESVQAAGYRLVSSPDLPTPDEVRPLLRSGFWTRLQGGGATGSTNDDCAALARTGAPEGTAVLATEQTAGRGRLGRSWTSPPGGLYLSVLLRPPIAPADAPPLALVAGIGLARGLAALGVETRLKWPNDVLLDGRKLAGILLEMSAEADRVGWVVAGCGVNVHRSAQAPADAAFLEEAREERGAPRGVLQAGKASADAPRPAAPRAPAEACLSTEPPTPPAPPTAPVGLTPPAPTPTTPRLADVAAALLDGLASAYADFLAGGFASLTDEYASRDALVGRAVTVSDADGRRA